MEETKGRNFDRNPRRPYKLSIEDDPPERPVEAIKCNQKEFKNKKRKGQTKPWRSLSWNLQLIMRLIRI